MRFLITIFATFVGILLSTAAHAGTGRYAQVIDKGDAIFQVDFESENECDRFAQIVGGVCSEKSLASKLPTLGIFQFPFIGIERITRVKNDLICDLMMSGTKDNSDANLSCSRTATSSDEARYLQVNIQGTKTPYAQIDFMTAKMCETVKKNEGFASQSAICATKNAENTLPLRATIKGSAGDVAINFLNAEFCEAFASNFAKFNKNTPTRCN